MEQETTDPWMRNMLSGEFEKAWLVSDEILKAREGKQNTHLPRDLQNVWNGESLEGKRVLVRCYHGLGDTIQFIRYAPLLKEIAKKVIVWVQPPLIPLLKTFKGIDQLLPLHEGSIDVDYDVDIEVMELPYIFRTTVDTVPYEIPYISVDPIVLPTNKKLSVGVVWKASPYDPRRGIPFNFLQPLNEVPDIQIYILQGDAKAAGWHKGFGIHPGESNLYNYARVIKGLDLVISIDSMPVHLAGAMGVPVWMLLHSEADWRWMRNRDDSPWYPTVRIFRQETAGDWTSVISGVCEELKKLVSSSIAK